MKHDAMDFSRSFAPDAEAFDFGEYLRRCLDSEYAVVGCLMRNALLLDHVADLLRPEHFLDAGMRAAYAAITALVSRSQAVDLVSVHEHLRSAGADVGLMALNAAAQTYAVDNSVRTHAQRVRAKHLEREVAHAAHQAVAMAEQPGDGQAKLAAVQQVFAKLADGGAKPQPKLAADLMATRIDHWSEVAGGAVREGIATGFRDLDEQLNGGMRAGHVYVLAARPSVGKSSLAERIAITVAQAGTPTLFLSQEMPAAELLDRAAAMIGGIDYGALQRGEIEDWSRVSAASDALAAVPLYIDDQPALTLLDIRAKAMAVRRHGLKLLVLDYLQLCAATNARDNRNGQIEEISRGLKALAKDFCIAILMLSQLNRAVESRQVPEPNLSDLRDSGAIEQDADTVMFLWPCREFGERQILGLTLAKNRQGKRGVRVPLEFFGRYQRWKSSEADLTPDRKQARGADKDFE